MWGYNNDTVIPALFMQSIQHDITTTTTTTTTTLELEIVHLLCSKRKIPRHREELVLQEEAEYLTGSTF